MQTCIVDGMNAINTPFALNFRNPLVSAPENARKYLYRQNALQTHILDRVPGDFLYSHAAVPVYRNTGSGTQVYREQKQSIIGLWLL